MKILISVIAYNEEQNIEKTLRDLIDNNFGFDIIVIDNGSSDGTVEACKKLNINYVSHCINTGSSTGTVMTYFLYAYKNNYDILCQFDGDGQHVASELKKIIEPVAEGKADYVIGSRYLNKGGFQSTFIRRFGIKLFSFFNSMIVGQKITDVTSGFRAYSNRVIQYFALEYRKEIYDINQLLLLSHYCGSRIIEVPIKMKERQYGKSEFDFFNSVIFPMKGLINIFGFFLESVKNNKREKNGIKY